MINPNPFSCCLSCSHSKWSKKSLLRYVTNFCILHTHVKPQLPHTRFYVIKIILFFLQYKFKNFQALVYYKTSQIIRIQSYIGSAGQMNTVYQKRMLGAQPTCLYVYQCVGESRPVFKVSQFPVSDLKV